MEFGKRAGGSIWCQQWEVDSAECGAVMAGTWNVYLRSDMTDHGFGTIAPTRRFSNSPSQFKTCGVDLMANPRWGILSHTVGGFNRGEDISENPQWRRAYGRMFANSTDYQMIRNDKWLRLPSVWPIISRTKSSGGDFDDWRSPNLER